MDDQSQMIARIADATARRTLELVQPPTRYLKSRDAAAYLGVAVLTLEKWRVYGHGPVFTRIGRFVRYDRQELDRFMTQHRSECKDSLRTIPDSVSGIEEKGWPEGAVLAIRPEVGKP